MIFSLFWEGAFIRGGAFILKSEILGGRLFEGGVYSRWGVYSRKYGMANILRTKKNDPSRKETGIFTHRAMVDQAHEGLCYQKKD